MKKNAGKKLLRARITMSHGHSAIGGGHIRISIEDAESSTCIAEASITGDENISKLFRSMQCDGDVEIFPSALPLYGLRMETRTVNVPIGKLYGDEASELACDTANRDNPGWDVDEYCRKYNSHKRAKDDTYQVTIRRWVQP